MSTGDSKRSPVCYIHHVSTGKIVEVRRGEAGYRPVETRCSPACLNAALPIPPTAEDVLAMRHGSLMGWNTKGADPAFWRDREWRW